jgi:hypothetical protein
VTGTGVGVSRPGRAQLTVVAGKAAGLVLEPGRARIVAGGEQPYRVFARDRFDNRVGEMTDQAVFSVREPGRCEGATCMSTVAGPYVVKATVERDDAPALVARARLTVIADRVARLRLDPGSEEIMAGARRRYTAHGFDRFGHPLGDVTELTAFSIRPSGRCVADSCGADQIGDYVVVGRHSGTGALGRARLAVRPARLARLVLDPRGRTVAAGVGQSFQARGLDAFGNDVGDLTADSVFDIAPSGSCVRASCSATEPGDYTVTARKIGTRVGGTAVLHVDVGPLARIVLEPATYRVTIGASAQFQVRGFDAAGNPRGDAARRTVLRMQRDGSCSGTACTATAPGTRRVFGAVPGTSLRAEAVLAADAKKPASLRLDPSVATVTVGSTQPYRVEALDDRGASLGDVTDAVRLSIDAGGSCGRVGCGARRPNTYQVTARLPGGAAGDPAVLHVRAGLPATLELEPRTATVTAGGARGFRAYGYDALGNFLGDVTRQTTFTVGPDGSCDGVNCTAAAAGQHEVVGRTVVGSARGTAALTAVPATRPSSPTTEPPPTTASQKPPESPAPVVGIAAQPATGRIAAGAWFAFAVRAQDAVGRDLGDFTAEATMAIEPDGSCTGGRCTAERAGTHRVLVTARDMQAAATLEVVAGQELTEVLLDPQVSSVRVGAAQQYRAWGFDAYGNNLGEVTDRTTFSIETVGPCPGGRCAAGQPDTYRVRGAVGGTAIVGEAQLEVIQVSAAKLVLAPAAGSVRAGSALAFRAHGYDDLGNDVGDLTATTRLSISSSGRCTPSGCTADRPGNYTVTGTTAAGAGGSELTAAASLQVTAIGPADLPVPIWLIGVAAVVIGLSGGVVLFWLFPGSEPLPPDPVQDSGDEHDRRDDPPGQHVDLTVRPTLGSPRVRTRQRRWQRPSLTIRVEPHPDPDGVQTMREGP